MQRDRQGGARLLDLAGHRDVFGGGRGATARMVMDQDDRGRVLFEGAFHEFARVDWHVVYGRVARDLIGDQPVAVVEIQNPRLLGPLPRQYRGQLSYQMVPVVQDRPIHHFGRGRADRCRLGDLERGGTRFAQPLDRPEIRHRCGERRTIGAEARNQGAGDRLGVAPGQGEEQDHFQDLVIGEGIRPGAEQTFAQPSAMPGGTDDARPTEISLVRDVERRQGGLQEFA